MLGGILPERVQAAAPQNSLKEREPVDSFLVKRKKLFPERPDFFLQVSQDPDDLFCKHKCLV
jgi:hypothetical protein